MSFDDICYWDRVVFTFCSNFSMSIFAVQLDVQFAIRRDSSNSGDVHVLEADRQELRGYPSIK